MKYITNKCINCCSRLSTKDSERGVLWCTLDCKKEFYLDNFAHSAGTKMWETEYNKQQINSRRKCLAKIKKSGLTFTEFIQSLNDEPKVKEEIIDKHRKVK